MKSVLVYVVLLVAANLCICGELLEELHDAASSRAPAATEAKAP